MNIKRMRGRNHRPNNGGGGSGSGGFSRNQQNGIPLNRNHVFDSSGPEMRLRGTAQQLHEKYTQLARDASSGGDRVTGEAYYQHAEHYFRIISAINQAQGQSTPAPQNGQQSGYNNGSQGQGQSNGQNEYRRPAQPQGSYNGNGYNQEQEPAESRGFEPRPAPRPEYQERRPERPREMPAEVRYDRPIDISSALEAELEAAVATPTAYAEQPAATVQERAAPVEPPAPAPRSIPIATAAPEEAAVPAPRRRGRPRLQKPEAQE